MVHIIASVATYPELRDALRERRLELGLTQLALDDCAGLADGWTSKAEMENGNKRWGNMSIEAALGALGLKLLVVADDDSLPAISRSCLYQSKNKDAAKRPLVTLPPPDAMIRPRCRSGSTARAGPPGGRLMAW